MNPEHPKLSAGNEVRYGGKTAQELALISETESDDFLRDLLNNGAIQFPDYAVLRATIAGIRTDERGVGEGKGAAGIGAAALGLEGVVGAATELVNGKVMEFDGHIPEGTLFQALVNRLSTDGFVVSSKQAADPKHTVISVKEHNETTSIIEILVNQREVADHVRNLQAAYEKEIDEQVQRLITSVQISPIDTGNVKYKVIDLVKKISGEAAFSDAFDSSHSLLSTVTLTAKVIQVLDELGQRAQAERETEVANIDALNQLYTAKLLSDAKCLSCSTPRIEETSACESCGSPLELRHYPDYKERLAKAGINI